MLGVEIIFNVSFESLLPPVVDANEEMEDNIKGRLMSAAIFNASFQVADVVLIWHNFLISR